MPITIVQRNKSITSLLNGTNDALKQVVPVQHKISKPQLMKELLVVQFGVFIGITGDIKGKLVLEAGQQTFGIIGEKMFGSKISDDMLGSFSGELGNMLAGNITTNINHHGMAIDITTPTVIERKAKISGYELAIYLKSSLENIGDLNIYLLLNEHENNTKNGL